jgi:hypothetical protein
VRPGSSACALTDSFVRFWTKVGVSVRIGTVVHGRGSVVDDLLCSFRVKLRAV